MYVGPVCFTESISGIVLWLVTCRMTCMVVFCWSGQLPVFHCQDANYQVYGWRHCQRWADINCNTGKSVTTSDSLSLRLTPVGYLSKVFP